MTIDLQRAILLAADNFTPLSRTPWAGRYIAEQFKSDVLGVVAERRIGESWEFSCDPSFPSLVEETRTPLSQLVSSNILVKLINAAHPLSLQLHPRDDFPGLKAGECGKPESWLILHAEPGAGIYLGFKESLTKAALKELLQSSDREALQQMLHFIPVKNGDYFEIEPGMPHAIGAGVTLIEPQQVRPGMSGVTYRMWDWNRKYQESGEVDAVNGKARPLHIEESLAIIDPAVTGAQLCERSHKLGTVEERGTGYELTAYPRNSYCQVYRLHAKTQAKVPVTMSGGFGIVTVLTGVARVTGKSGGAVTIKRGRTALLPTSGFPFTVTAESELDLVLIRSASTR